MPLKTNQKKLIDLRERLLQLTKEIDQRMQEQAQQSRKLLEEILSSEDIEQAATEALQGNGRLLWRSAAR